MRFITATALISLPSAVSAQRAQAGGGSVPSGCPTDAQWFQLCPGTVASPKTFLFSQGMTEAWNTGNHVCLRDDGGDIVEEGPTNPSWFYFKAGPNGGKISLKIGPGKSNADSEIYDVDFMTYGPFDDLTSLKAGCGSYVESQCGQSSYSDAEAETYSETLTAGKFYILIVSNYGEVDTFDLVQLADSTATVNCDQVCFPNYEPVSSSCNPCQGKQSDGMSACTACPAAVPANSDGWDASQVGCVPKCKTGYTANTAVSPATCVTSSSGTGSGTGTGGTGGTVSCPTLPTNGASWSTSSGACSLVCNANYAPNNAVSPARCDACMGKQSGGSSACAACPALPTNGVSWDTSKVGCVPKCSTNYAPNTAVSPARCDACMGTQSDGASACSSCHALATSTGLGWSTSQVGCVMQCTSTLTPVATCYQCGAESDGARTCSSCYIANVGASSAGKYGVVYHDTKQVGCGVSNCSDQMVVTASGSDCVVRGTSSSSGSAGDDDDDNKCPWWCWLLIALAICIFLLLIVLLVLWCLRKPKQQKSYEEEPAHEPVPVAAKQEDATLADL